MNVKYKPTGCARFLIFLVIAAPLAWIGANYINGEDPIENIKTIFSKQEVSTTHKEKSVKDLEKEIRELEDRLRRCEQSLRER